MKEKRFESVWDAIEPSPAEAAGMKARAELMLAIRKSRFRKLLSRMNRL